MTARSHILWSSAGAVIMLICALVAIWLGLGFLLLGLHLVIALITSVVTLRGLTRINRSGDLSSQPSQLGLVQVVQLEKDPSQLGLVQRGFQFSHVLMCLAWPLAFLKALPSLIVSYRLARHAEPGSNHALKVASVAAVSGEELRGLAPELILLGGLSAEICSSPSRPFSIAILIALLSISPILTLLGGVLNPTGFIGLLRRSPFNMLASFMIVSASVLAQVVLTRTLLLNWAAPQPLAPSALLATLREIFAFKPMLEAIQQLQFPGFDPLSSAAIGILFYLGFITHAAAFSAWSRSDDDICTIAAHYLYAGKIESAASWIRRVKKPSVRSRQVEALIALQNGQAERYLQLVDRSLRLQLDLEPDPRLRSLQALTLTKVVPVPTGAFTTLVHFIHSHVENSGDLILRGVFQLAADGLLPPPADQQAVAPLVSDPIWGPIALAVDQSAPFRSAQEHIASFRCCSPTQELNRILLEWAIRLLVIADGSTSNADTCNQAVRFVDPGFDDVDIAFRRLPRHRSDVYASTVILLDLMSFANGVGSSAAEKIEEQLGALIDHEDFPPDLAEMTRSVIEANRRFHVVIREQQTK